jgi:hypothetical protein
VNNRPTGLCQAAQNQLRKMHVIKHQIEAVNRRRRDIHPVLEKRIRVQSQDFAECPKSSVFQILVKQLSITVNTRMRGKQRPEQLCSGTGLPENDK